MRRVSSVTTRPIGVAIATEISGVASIPADNTNLSSTSIERVRRGGSARGIADYNNNNTHNNNTNYAVTEAARSSSLSRIDFLVSKTCTRPICASSSAVASRNVSSSAVALRTPVRALIIPPPAPRAPTRFATYTDEGRKDVFHDNGFIARASGSNPEKAATESKILGNTLDDDDELEGMMLQAPRKMFNPADLVKPEDRAKTLDEQRQRLKLPGVGGNSAPIDELPRPPFEEFGRVLEAIRQVVYKLSLRKHNRSLSLNSVNPSAVPILAVSMAAVLSNLSPDIRKLLRNPLFSGLEQTARGSPSWFEVSQDSLQVRLTVAAHHWGGKTVPTEAVPVPPQIEQAMFIDQRQRENAAQIRQMKEEMEAKEREKREAIRSGKFKSSTDEPLFSPRKREKFANPFAVDAETTLTNSAIENTVGSGIPLQQPQQAEVHAEKAHEPEPFKPRARTLGKSTVETAKEATSTASSAPTSSAEPTAFVPRLRSLRPNSAATSTASASAQTQPAAPSIDVGANATNANADGSSVSSGVTPSSEGVLAGAPAQRVTDSDGCSTCAQGEEAPHAPDNGFGDLFAFGSVPPPPPPAPKGGFVDAAALAEMEAEAAAEEEEAAINGSTSGSVLDEMGAFGAIPPPPPPPSQPSQPQPSPQPSSPEAPIKTSSPSEFKPRFGNRIQIVTDDEKNRATETAAAKSSSSSPSSSSEETAPAAEAVTRKPVFVARNKYTTQGKVRAADTIAFDRICKNAGDISPRDLAINGGKYKALLTKDSKVMGYVDTSIAPLNKEEIAMIPALQAHCGLGGPYIPDISVRRLPEPPLIFPPSMTIPTLPELEFLDIIYRRYCKIIPSQVAYALFEFIPTYYIELRTLIRLMPQSANEAIFKQEKRDRNGRLVTLISFFRKYTLLFDLIGFRGNASESPSVRINWRLSPYLRRHPRFGMADPHMRRYSLEKEGGASLNAAGVVSSAFADTSLPEDSSLAPTQQEKTLAEDRAGYLKENRLNHTIFEILLGHMPRTQDKAVREKFVNLVDWINSFPPEDLEVINQVPQERIIRIILKYCRIFQLSSTTDDMNLFSPNHAKHAKEAAEKMVAKQKHQASVIAAGVAAAAGAYANKSSSLAVDDCGDDLDDAHAPVSLSDAAFVEGLDGEGVDAEIEEFHDEDSEGLLTEMTNNNADAVPTNTDVAGGGNTDTIEADATGMPAEGSVTPPVSALASQHALGTSSLAAISDDADLSEEDKGRVKRFTATLEDGLIGMDDILLGTDGEGKPELMDRGGSAEEYGDDELPATDDAEEGYSLGEDERHTEGKYDGKGATAANAATAAIAGGVASKLNDSNRSHGHKQQQQKGSAAPEQEGDEAEEDALGFSSGFETLLLRRLPKDIAPRSLCDCDVKTSPNPDLIRTILSHIPPPTGLFGSRDINSATPHQSPTGGGLAIPPPPMRMVDGFGSRSIPEAPGARGGSFGSQKRTADDEDDSGTMLRVWRWISLENIYNALTSTEKRALRPYRGLANFIRLHGRLCEVSEDMRYVVAHDPGVLSPLIPTLRFFSVEDRLMLPDSYDTDLTMPIAKALAGNATEKEYYAGFVRGGQFPTNRVALQVMDPRNPLLAPEVIFEEIANFLPDHPVTYKSMLKRVPPLMRAAMPAQFLRSVRRSRHLTLIIRQGTFYIMKSSLGEVTNADTDSNMSSLEETLAAVKSAINLHGTTKITVWMRLSFGPRNYIKRNYDNIGAFFLAFPKVFYIENVTFEHSRVGGADMIRRMKQVVHLVSNIAAREADRKETARAELERREREKEMEAESEGGASDGTAY